ncbi:stAR-related lipid transfer protein 9 isoform X2 [Ornithorhynchus anatinus]|uniref:stAR-related lipid transfer protein 9 isoform X2 n=1 Tax=Ornithorhynchus anatinus TaxID=9258 RepID=UPI0010A81A48|nr:stAR-related lipid transfer protein 9 isoform X2 [Ornithorhynchus anatinus]
MANVRVAVRVRPLSQRECADGGRIIIEVDGNVAKVRKWKVNCGARASRDSKEKIMAFGFDYCYWSVNPEDPHYASQEMVFQDLGTAVLAGAAQGYNICLFAYGQTGSGKTYTMMGTPGLFLRGSHSLEQPPPYRIRVSFLEIYNERVRDLLKQSDQKKPFTLRVREHPEAGPYVQGLSQHVVTNYEQVVRLLEEGIANRITAATHVHEASSRSHAIFTIHYTQALPECSTPSEIASKISLVDLAGSERANPSSCKPQLTEGSSINRSLMTLGIVISTLAQNSQSSARMGEPSKSTTSSPGASRVRGSTRRQPYIPYRDSVLTWLLRDSLGGNSQTIMVATVSPAHSSYRETISTLRYASSAKNIINQPQVNEDANVKLIRELRKEIDCLKTMLLSLEMKNFSPLYNGRNRSLAALVLQNELQIGHQTQEWAEMWSAWDTLLKQYQVDGIMEKAGEATDPSLPHLLALDSDVLSPGVVLYRLREGTTRIGRIDSDQEQDIVLQGQWIERNHCTIRSVCGEVTLQPAQGARCAVNGKEVIDACRLSQGDIIKLGKAQKFRFNHPAEAAILRQRRLVGEISPWSGNGFLDWQDLDGKITWPGTSGLRKERIKSDAEPGEPQPKLLEQEVVLRGQIRQQLVVKDLRQLRRTGPGQVEREVELDQTLISKQIKDNQQWLNREQAWLTALQLRWPEDPEAQTEPGASNETENRVRWGPPARSCPAARDRKGLVQLPLLRGDAPRSADPGARCRRVKSPPEKTVRKQKRLEAQRRLKWLDALGWLRKKNARQFPELDPSTGAVITRPRRRSVCPRTGSQHPRGSCSWPLAPTFRRESCSSPGPGHGLSWISRSKKPPSHLHTNSFQENELCPQNPGLFTPEHKTAVRRDSPTQDAHLILSSGVTLGSLGGAPGLCRIDKDKRSGQMVPRDLPSVSRSAEELKSRAEPNSVSPGSRAGRASGAPGPLEQRRRGERDPQREGTFLTRKALRGTSGGSACPWEAWPSSESLGQGASPWPETAKSLSLPNLVTVMQPENSSPPHEATLHRFAWRQPSTDLELRDWGADPWFGEGGDGISSDPGSSLLGDSLLCTRARVETQQSDQEGSSEQRVFPELENSETEDSQLSQDSLADKGLGKPTLSSGEQGGGGAEASPPASPNASERELSRLERSFSLDSLSDAEGMTVEELLEKPGSEFPEEVPAEIFWHRQRPQLPVVCQEEMASPRAWARETRAKGALGLQMSTSFYLAPSPQPLGQKRQIEMPEFFSPIAGGVDTDSWGSRGSQSNLGGPQGAAGSFRASHSAQGAHLDEREGPSGWRKLGGLKKWPGCRQLPEAPQLPQGRRGEGKGLSQATWGAKAAGEGSKLTVKAGNTPSRRLDGRKYPCGPAGIHQATAPASSISPSGGCWERVWPDAQAGRLFNLSPSAPGALAESRPNFCCPERHPSGASPGLPEATGDPNFHNNFFRLSPVRQLRAEHERDGVGPGPRDEVSVFWGATQEAGLRDYPPTALEARHPDPGEPPVCPAENGVPDSIQEAFDVKQGLSGGGAQLCRTAGVTAACREGVFLWAKEGFQPAARARRGENSAGELVLLCSGSSLAHPLEKMYSRQVSAEEIDRDEREVYVKDPELSPHPPYWSQPLPPSTASSEAACQDALTESALEPQGRTAPEVARDSNRDCPFLTEFDWKGDPAAFLQAECSEASLSLPGSPSSRAVQQGPGEASKSHGRPGEYNHSVSFSMAQERPFPQDASEEVGDLNDSPGNATQNFTHPGPGHQGEPAVQVLWPSTASKSGKMNCPLAAAAGGGQWPPLNIAGRAPDDPVPQAGALSGETWNSGYNLGLSLHNTSPGDEGLKDGRVPLGSNPATRGQSHPVPSVRETPSPPRAGSEAVLGSKGNSVEFVFPAEVTTPEEPDLGKEWESRKGREGENVPRKSLLTSLSERINDDEMAKLRSSLPQLENDIWEIRSIQRGPRLAAPPPGGPAEAGGGARADLGMIHLFLNPEDFRSDLAHGDQSVFAKKVQGEGGPRSGKAATAAEETDSCSQRDQSKTSSCRDQSGTNNCSREEPDLGSCSPRDEPEKDGGSHGDQPETEICSQEEPETHTSNHRDEQENDGCGHGDRQTQKSPQPAPNPGDCPEQNQFESEHIHPAESPVVTQDGLGSGGTGERPRFSQRASQNPVTPGGWDSRPTATRFAEILEAGDPLEMEGKMGFRGSSFPGKVINSEGALGVLRAQGGRDEEWDPLKRVRSQEEDKGAPWSREPPSPGRARARGQPKYQDSARPLQAQKGSVGHPRRGDSESTLSLDSPEVSSPETPGPSGAAARDPDLDSDGDSPSEAGAVAGVERRERGEGRPESQNPPGPPARGSAEDHQAVEGSTRLPSGTAAWGQAETSLLLGENKETRNFSCRDYGGGREAAERNWDPSGGIVCEADSEAVVGNTERRNPVGGPPGTEALPAPELKPLSFRGGAKEERREAAALSANELPEASPEPLGLAQASSRKSQAGAGLYEALGNHSEEHLAQGITRPHSETESGDAAGSRGPLVRYRQNGVQADILRGQSEPPKPSEHPRATADPVRDPSGPRWRLHVIQGGTRGSPLESEAPPNRAARSTSPASSNPGGRTVPGWGWGGPDGDLKTEEKLKGYLDPSGPGPLHDPPASEKELASSASREGGRGQPLSGRRSLDLSSSPVEVQRGLSQAKGGTAAAVVEPQWEGSGLRGQRAGVAGPGQSRGPVGSARLGGPLRTATSLPVPDAASAHHPTAGSPVPQVAKVICLGETQPRECGPAASSHQAAAAPAGSGPSGALSARGAFWTDTTLDSEGNVRSGQTEACGKWSPPFPSPARDSICPGGTEEGPEHRKFQDQGGCRALSLLEAEEETCAARQLSRTRTEPLRSPLAVGNQHVEPPVDVPEADSPLPEARGTPGGPIPPVACFPATQMGLLSEGSEARELPTALSHGLERGNTLRAAPGSHPLQRTSPGSRRDSDKGDRYPGNSPPVVSPGLWEPGKLTSCRSAELPGEAVHPTIPQGRDPGDTASSKEKESSLPPSEAASPRTGAGEQEPRAASPHIYSGSGYRPPVHGAKRLPSSEAAPWEGPSTSTPGARARGDSPDSNRRRVGSPWKQEQKPNQLPRPRGRRNPPQAGSAGGARHSRARGAVRSKRKRLKLVSNRNNPSPLGFRSAGSRRIPHRAPVVLLQAVDGPGGLGGQEEQGARAPPGHSSPQPGLGVSSKPGLSPPASSGSLRDLSMSVEPPSPSATDTWGHEAFWAVGPGDSSPAASADSTLQETREAWGAADCGQTPSRHGPEPASVPSSSSRASPAEPTPDGGAGRAPDGPGPGKPAPACCEGGVAAHSGEERDLPRFRGSDVTPYLCCRQLGGAGSGFGSVGVISGAQVPGGLEPRRLTRCSSLGSVATSQSSPFHSHLNTYAGAWGLSRTPGSSEGLQSEGEATSGPNDPSGEAAEAAARASAEEPDPERMQVAVRLCVAKMSSGRARTATCERSTQTLPLPGRNRGRPRRCWNGPAEPAQRPGAGPVSSRDQAAVCIGTQAFPPYLSHASRANSAPLGNLSRQIQAEGSPSGKWVGWGKSAVDSSPPDGRSGWGRLGSETGPHSPGPPNTTLSLPEDPGHRMKSEQSLPTRDPRPENRSPGWSSPSCSPLVSWATGSEPGSQIHGLWGSAASTVASHSGSCGPLPPGLSPRGQGSGPRRACRGSSLVDRASSPILTLRATRPYPWLPEALANSAGDPQEPGTNPHRARERGGDSSARKDPTGERANRSGAGVRTCQEKQSLRPSDCPGPAKIPLSARLGRPQVPLERHGRGRPFYGPPARTLSEGPCRPLPLEGQSGVVRRSASCFLLPVTSEGPGTCSALAASREEAPRWSSQPAIGDEAPVSPPLPGSHCSWRPPASSSSGTGEGAPGLGPASDGGPERTSGRGLGPQCSSLKDLPVHDKFSDWSGVRSSSPRGGAGGPLEGPEASLGEPESRSQETPRPQRQLARVGAGIQPAVSPLLPALSVELAEAKLHYGLGATDALLQVLQSGMGEALAPASPTPLAREELYGRHAKAIEALRRERAERFRRPRAQSLSPQKDLSLQPAQGMVRDAELPSQRRDYLQQLRKDVVATTRFQETQPSSAPCPSEVELLLLLDHRRAWRETEVEIARARAEREKRRLRRQMVSQLRREETKLRALVSSSSLATGSGPTLPSSPTSGYHSGSVAWSGPCPPPESQGDPDPLSSDSARDRPEGRRNDHRGATPSGAPLASEPGSPSRSPDPGCRSSRPGRSSPGPLYQDLTQHILASVTAEVMEACSNHLPNLFRGRVAAGWKYQCEEQEVLVYYKAFPSSTRHSFLGAGVVPLPLPCVWAAVRDPTLRPLYDKAVRIAQLHRRVTGSIQLGEPGVEGGGSPDSVGPPETARQWPVYLVSSTSPCFSKQPRDFCCVSVEAREGSLAVSAARSVSDPSMPRPRRGLVRGEILPSAWLLQPDTVDGRDVTRVIHLTQVELGGPGLPARPRSSFVKCQPLAIAGLAAFLLG